MTLTDWLTDRFNNVSDWLKAIWQKLVSEDAEIKDEQTDLEKILAGIGRIEKDQQFFATQLFNKVNEMSAQTDALTAEVAQVVNVLTSATPLIDAAVAAEAQLAAIAGGAATDTAAITKATNDLTAARTAFSAEVGKLTPAATTPTT